MIRAKLCMVQIERSEVKWRQGVGGRLQIRKNIADHAEVFEFHPNSRAILKLFCLDVTKFHLN